MPSPRTATTCDVHASRRTAYTSDELDHVGDAQDELQPLVGEGNRVEDACQGVEHADAVLRERVDEQRMPVSHRVHGPEEEVVVVPQSLGVGVDVGRDEDDRGEHERVDDGAPGARAGDRRADASRAGDQDRDEDAEPHARRVEQRARDEAQRRQAEERAGAEDRDGPRPGLRPARQRGRPSMDGDGDAGQQERADEQDAGDGVRPVRRRGGARRKDRDGQSGHVEQRQAE